MRDAISGKERLQGTLHPFVLDLLPMRGHYGVLAVNTEEGYVVCAHQDTSLKRAKRRAIELVTNDEEVYSQALVIDEHGETLYRTDEVEQ